MKVSLILPTVDRREDPARFLDSLARQSHRCFEVIVVDQNPDDRVASLLPAYAEAFSIVHLRTHRRGISHARNLALEQPLGNIVAFPDDDCRYPADLLERVEARFREPCPWDGVTGRSIDQDGRPRVRFGDRHPGETTLANVMGRGRGISYCIFLRRRVVERVGRFDERLGVGAGTPWGAGEESDYLIRALKAGMRLYFDPALEVHHPSGFQLMDERALVRARAYGAGAGKVLRLHAYPPWRAARLVLQPLVASALALARARWRKSRYHATYALGLIDGLRD